MGTIRYAIPSQSGLRPLLLLQAVDDTYFVDEANLGSFSENVTNNDVINVDYFISMDVPPCFAQSDENPGQIVYVGPGPNGGDCCGTFTFTYTLFGGDLSCTSTVRIIVECGTPKKRLQRHRIATRREEMETEMARWMIPTSPVWMSPVFMSAKTESPPSSPPTPTRTPTTGSSPAAR